MQAIVDREVKQLLNKQEAEEQLASLQQRREALQAERGDKQHQRCQRELQLMRFAEKPHSSAQTQPRDSADSQTAAQEAEGYSQQGQGTSMSSSDGRQTSHIPEAGIRLPAESSRPVSPEPLSQEEEEVRRQAVALDDAVDTCQAQIQYLDSSVAECKGVSHLSEVTLSPSVS